MPLAYGSVTRELQITDKAQRGPGTVFNRRLSSSRTFTASQQNRLHCNRADAETWTERQIAAVLSSEQGGSVHLTCCVDCRSHLD